MSYLDNYFKMLEGFQRSNKLLASSLRMSSLDMFKGMSLNDKTITDSLGSISMDFVKGYKSMSMGGFSSDIFSKSSAIPKSISSYLPLSTSLVPDNLSSMMFDKPLLDKFDGFSDKMSSFSDVSNNLVTPRLHDILKGIVPDTFKEEVLGSKTSFSHLNSTLNSFYSDISESDFDFSDEDTIDYEGDEYSIEDVEDEIEKIFDEYDILQDEEIISEKTIESVLTDLREESGPKRKIREIALKWIGNIIRGLIANLIVATFFFLVSQPRNTETQVIHFEPHKIQKEYKKELVKHVDDKQILKDYRIVTARSGLIVREKPARDSKRIGKLYWSATAKLVKKKKNWSLVEWTSQDEETQIKGWVFSRYLGKIM